MVELSSVELNANQSAECPHRSMRAAKFIASEALKLWEHDGWVYVHAVGKGKHVMIPREAVRQANAVALKIPGPGRGKARVDG